MKLCIDVGNTIIKFIVFDGDKQIKKRTTATDKSAKEGHFLEFFSTCEEIEQIVLATVVPEISQIMREDIKKHFNLEPIEVKKGTKTGIKIDTTNPKEVGADIVAMGVAAANKWKGTKMIVSFGTATVYLLVKDNDIKGVSFSPGVDLSRKALAVGASQLRITEMQLNGEIFGRDTEESIKAGIIYSQAGAVEKFHKLAEKAYGDVKLIITGGAKSQITPYIDIEAELVDDLPILGLKIIGDKNA